MHRALIDSLCAQSREAEWLEFKVNNDRSQLIGELLSALSNSACLADQKYGYLVYGVEDGSHNVVGTSLRPRDCKGKGNEDLEPWLARLLSPRMDFRILEHEYDGKPVVIFRVQAATSTPVKFSGTAYIRIGSHKRTLKDFPERERQIWSTSPACSFEEELVKENLSSDDVLTLIDYPSFFDLLGLPLPDNRVGILERLVDENLIVESEGGYGILGLGAILLAKRVEEFPTLARKAVRAVVYSDETRLNARKEQCGTKGYAVGFEGLVDWVSDQLPANEIIEEALRVNMQMYPKIAIREFIANALIHQDFSISGTGPMVEIFPSRLEITNPGRPLIDTNRFIDHPPRSRNEKLAAMMRRMNICEERGSGVDRAISAIEVTQLPAPDFEADEGFMRVTLFAHRELRDMDRLDKVRAVYQHCCLRWVCKDFMTNSSLRGRFGIEQRNYPMASKMIKETLAEELIRIWDPDSQSKRDRKYVPFWA